MVARLALLRAAAKKNSTNDNAELSTITNEVKTFAKKMDYSTLKKAYAAMSDQIATKFGRNQNNTNNTGAIQRDSISRDDRRTMAKGIKDMAKKLNQSASLRADSTLLKNNVDGLKGLLFKDKAEEKGKSNERTNKTFTLGNMNDVVDKDQFKELASSVSNMVEALKKNRNANSTKDSQKLMKGIISN